MERIRFYFDPRCPWCYLTSRWASRLEELGEVSIDWALFSLEVVNRPEGVDPLTIDTAFRADTADGIRGPRTAGTR